MRLLSDIDVLGKRVFLRADLDVSTADVANSKSEARNSKLEQIEGATRLINLKPTVDWLLENGVRQIIIAGHIDRPEKPDPSLSTRQLLEPLQKILGREIIFKEDLEVQPRQDLILFENLRFWPGEVANDGQFAKELASLADVYVNEAFGNCHRNHASMVAMPALFPDVEDLLESERPIRSETHGRRPRSRRPEGHRPRRAAGLHVQKEVETLSALLNKPQRPFVAIVGGAKIETKVPVIENLAKIADWVLVGGELPIEIVKNGSKYPQNVVIATLADSQKDVANSSIIQIIELVKGAKTVVWNGPMGLFEEGFENATVAIAQAIVESGAYSIVGGGDTTQFLASKNFLSRFSFVSSGGGAMLEFLSGRELPGLKVLE